MRPGRVLFAAFALVPVSIGLSFIHPWGDLRSPALDRTAILAGSEVPADVKTLLASKCGDCHSNGTHWPLYSRFAPGSWLMERDISAGRKHMNLSEWQQADSEKRSDLLAKIGSEAATGEMPVPQYLLLHPSARLTDAEIQAIYAWTRSERKRLRSQAESSGKANTSQ